jgi:hypothetical protein
MSPFGQVIPVTGLNSGFPGTLSRAGDPLTVSKPVLSTTAHAVSFGAPVVVVPTSGGGDSIQSVADFIAGSGNLTAAKFAGIAIREVKTMTTFPTDPSTPQSGAYAPGDMAEFAVRGTISIKVNVGTPVSQAAVYIRKTLNGAIPAGVVGGFEAAPSDPSNCVALTNVVFKDGRLDANNVAEATIMLRSAA